MRWWGLYTQRRPGIDGGKTAILEPEELDDKYFMLRVRIDGGRLTPGPAARRSPRSPTTTRAAPPTSPTGRTSSCTGCASRTSRRSGGPGGRRAEHHRGLRRRPARDPRLAGGGRRRDEVIDATPGDRGDHAALHRQPGVLQPAAQVQDRDLRRLQDVVHETNDISFVGVVHPEHGPGFDLWVGGGLSTNPQFAKRLGAFVPLDEVPEVWAGVCGIFRDYGYRRLRNRARLKFLVADWGPAKFREVLETEYLKRTLLDGPAPAPCPGRRPRPRRRARAEGRQAFYVGFAPAGRPGRRRHAGADRGPGRGGRLGPGAHHRGAEDADPGRARRARRGAGRRRWRRWTCRCARGLPPHTMACTGIEFCKLAIVETKKRACGPDRRAGEAAAGLRQPADHQRERLPELLRAHPDRRHRPEGPAGPGRDGEQVEGFQVHLGGHLGATWTTRAPSAARCAG